LTKEQEKRAAAGFNRVAFLAAETRERRNAAEYKASNVSREARKQANEDKPMRTTNGTQQKK
jgi:hypothetical protein